MAPAPSTSAPSTSTARRPFNSNDILSSSTSSLGKGKKRALPTTEEEEEGQNKEIGTSITTPRRVLVCVTYNDGRMSYEEVEVDSTEQKLTFAIGRSTVPLPSLDFPDLPPNFDAEGDEEEDMPALQPDDAMDCVASQSENSSSISATLSSASPDLARDTNTAPIFDFVPPSAGAGPSIKITRAEVLRPSRHYNVNEQNARLKLIKKAVKDSKDPGDGGWRLVQNLTQCQLLAMMLMLIALLSPEGSSESCRTRFNGALAGQKHTTAERVALADVENEIFAHAGLFVVIDGHDLSRCLGHRFVISLVSNTLRASPATAILVKIYGDDPDAAPTLYCFTAQRFVWTHQQLSLYEAPARHHWLYGTVAELQAAIHSLNASGLAEDDKKRLVRALDLGIRDFEPSSPDLISDKHKHVFTWAQAQQNLSSVRRANGGRSHHAHDTNRLARLVYQVATSYRFADGDNVRATSFAVAGEVVSPVGGGGREAVVVVEYELGFEKSDYRRNVAEAMLEAETEGVSVGTLARTGKSLVYSNMPMLGGLGKDPAMTAQLVLTSTVSLPRPAHHAVLTLVEIHDPVADRLQVMARGSVAYERPATNPNVVHAVLQLCDPVSVIRSGLRARVDVTDGALLLEPSPTRRRDPISKRTRAAIIKKIIAAAENSSVWQVALRSSDMTTHTTAIGALKSEAVNVLGTITDDEARKLEQAFWIKSSVASILGVLHRPIASAEANRRITVTSILGTWPGSPEEVWQPASSSLLQVLVSIQAMILGTAYPYFNEPGYGKPQNNKANKDYNSNIHLATVRHAQLTWMEDEFKDGLWGDIIALHFKYKRISILENVKGWAKLDPRMQHWTPSMDRLAGGVAMQSYDAGGGAGGPVAHLLGFPSVDLPAKSKGKGKAVAASTPPPVQRNLVEELKGKLDVVANWRDDDFFKQLTQ